MLALLRRLFRRNRPSVPDQATNASPDDALTWPPAIATSTLPDVSDFRVAGTATLAIHVGVSNASVTRYDAEAAWARCLEEAGALQQSLPDARESPDAAQLLRLLASGPEAVIRQLPAAARDALTICDDPSLPRAQLARKLEQDPALLQALLRTANSVAMSSGRGTILSIDQALDRIGMAGARAVVLASCVDGLLSQPGGEYNAMAADVWAHMVRTAPLARALAPAFAADPDEAFAIALLHDVGKLVIFDRISVLRTARRRPVIIPSTFMHQLLQLLHEPIGALAAERWSMGERASSAIGTHHRRGQAVIRNVLAETLFVAEHADHAARRNEPLDIDAVWRTGQLTGSPARASSVLQRLAAAA